MHFRLLCECGNEISVSEGAAGVSVACACGRKILVPELTELRRRAAAGELRWSRYGEGEAPPLPPNRTAEAARSALRWVLLVVGGVVLLAGAGLYFGNRAGLVPTSRYAAYIVMAVGVGIMGFAGRAMAAQEDKEEASRFEEARLPQSADNRVDPPNRL